MDQSEMKSAISGAAVQSDKSMISATRNDKMGTKDELFKLNQLWYRVPPGLALASKRVMTRSNFQQQTYPNISSKQIVMTINTGEFYVSAPTSYLVLRVGIDKADTTPGINGNAYALLTNGDILNLIDEVYFQSASGTEVAREIEKGLCNSTIIRATLSQEFLNSAGELSGWPGGTLRQCYDGKGWAGTPSTTAPFLYPLRNTTYQDTTIGSLSDTSAKQMSTSYGSTTGTIDLAYTTDGAATNPRGPRTFIVPMKRVLSCFAPYMNALFPAAALAGGVLTIRFKNTTESLTAAGSAFTAVGNTDAQNQALANAFLSKLGILDCYILWDSFQLNDSVLRRLNEISAGKEGLSVMFDCWDWSQTQASTLAAEAQVSQARSIVSRSLCVVRDSAMTTNPFANSLCSEAAVSRETGFDNQYITGGTVQPIVNTFQSQLGSLYFPQQPLEYPEEMCMNLYYVLGKNYLNPDETSCVTLDDFYGAQGKGMYSGSFPSITNKPPYGGTYTGDRFQYTKTNLPPWSLNWGGALYGFLAERSQLLQLTGLPISNARLLRHKFTFNQGTKSTAPRTIDVFTQYARVMKVFLGGRIVMRE